MEHVGTLSVDQKLEFVRKELEDTKEEIRRLRANAERDLQHHEVNLWLCGPPCLGSEKCLGYVHVSVAAFKGIQVD